MSVHLLMTATADAPLEVNFPPSGRRHRHCRQVQRKALSFVFFEAAQVEQQVNEGALTVQTEIDERKIDRYGDKARDKTLSVWRQ